MVTTTVRVTKSVMMSSRTRWVVGLLCAASILIPSLAAAWQRTVDSGANPPVFDEARAVAVMPTSRNVASAGVVDVFFGPMYSVSLFEPNRGEPIWTHLEFTINRDGEARAVAATDDKVVSAGIVNNDVTGNDFTVMSHFLEFGFPIWKTDIDGSIPCNDRANAVAIDAAGDVVAAGALGDNDFGTVFFVVKLDGNTGSELWRYSVTNDGEAFAVAVDSTGDVFAAGTIDGEFTVVKIDGADGEEEWRSTSGDGRAVDIALDDDGAVAAVGEMSDTCGGSLPCGVVRFDGSNGDELWRRNFRDFGSTGGGPAAVATGVDGDVFVAGADEQDGFDAFAVAAYTSDGSTLWRYLRPGGDAPARANDITVGGDGVYATGAYEAGGRYMALVMLTFSDGDEEWFAQVDGGFDGGRNEGLAIALDADENVVAAGVLNVDDDDEPLYGVVKRVGFNGTDFFGDCGDGNLDGDEQCDDGNNQDGDCCSAACTFEAVESECPDDGNECTDDVCNATGTCVHPDNTDSCDDGNGCTSDDVCSNGQCAGEIAPIGTECNTFNPCFDGACNADGTCVPTANTDPCNDFNACTGNDTCGNGLCAGTPLTGTTCNDGNACTGDGTCQQGTCAPGAPLPAGTACASDFNVCTDDVCNANGQCAHPFNNAPCDDGNVCTPGGACAEGACVLGATTSTTTTSTTSTTVSTTSTSSSTSSTSTTTTSTTTTSTSTTSTTLQACTEDAPCDDGDLCNGQESCEGGFCRPPAQATCRRGAAEAYVSAFRADEVAVIDVAERTLMATIPVAGSPWGIVWHPDGSRVYVTSRRGDSVSAIDTRTRTVVGTAPVGREPLGIAIDPSGQRVWVANHGDSTVSVLDASSLALVATVRTGRGPAGIAVHPAGSRVYVSNYRSATLSVIDAASATVTATVDVDELPLGVAVHPDGTKVYVTSFRARNVDVVGTTSATVLGTIRVGRKPVGVAFDRAGGRAFVASSGDDVLVVIDTAADQVVEKVPVGRLPLGVAVDLSRDQPWVTDADSDTVTIVGDGDEPLGMPRTPVAFGAFIGSPPGRCPTPAPRCDDANPFTRDACGPAAGCEHVELVGLEGVAAGVRALTETVATAPLGDGPLAQRLRIEVPALDGVIAALGNGGDRAAARLAKRRLSKVVRLLERARKRAELGPDGGRLLDLARETRRRLKLALRAR